MSCINYRITPINCLYTKWTSNACIAYILDTIDMFFAFFTRPRYNLEFHVFLEYNKLMHSQGEKSMKIKLPTFSDILIQMTNIHGGEDSSVPERW